MAVTVETLEKLERKLTVALPLSEVQKEVEARLRRLSKKVKMSGFRPGKVPMTVVAQQYGYSVENEVLQEKVGQAFYKAIQEAQLSVAGAPSFKQKTDGVSEDELAFDAVFEVFPEVKLGDLSSVEVERVSADVDDDAIDRTIDILRRQRRTFNQRAADEAAAEGDRATVDFEGKIDGEPFEGGKAEGFAFVLGEGQMLKEFEDAVQGMKVGETKTFQLNFPADYHGKEVAGKQADFLITLKKLETQVLPEVDDAFAKSLGVADGTVDALRADIRNNLEREVKFRLLNRNKQAVMDALLKTAELDLPQSMVTSELQRMVESARAELRARGIKDADKAPIPQDVFKPQAERRVRLGLVVADLVKANDLGASKEQVQNHVNELAASYERPEEVVRWYYSEPQRIAEVEGIVIEANVTDFVLEKAKVTDKKISFEELMGQQ
ncbi:Trigger factor [Saezia sanguinis]|jgi:trigger factor|uniref:Trigger factor n=1 Tax=Saezia sanguinis TaxID=1965230 RepID=A0A433SDJ0_9BURK|nr:trigger factor [Saezia sanguinis]RUS66811.1 Trigger factor [Saezia sanguinis]